VAKSRPRLLQDPENDRQITIQIDELPLTGKVSDSEKTVGLTRRVFSVDVDGIEDLVTIVVHAYVPNKPEYVQEEPTE